MGEIVKFPSNLNPGAKEFRPRNRTLISNLHAQAEPYVPYTPISGTHVVRPSSNPTIPAYSRSAATEKPVPPTRTLLLNSVPRGVSETSVRRDLEVFGDVRAVQMERLFAGVLIVHFYDLRHAQAAMEKIREKNLMQRTQDHAFDAVSENNRGKIHQPPRRITAARGLISGCAVWAQFLKPVVSALTGGQNQGTLVVFNLDTEVPPWRLKQIFEAFGAVREIREAPVNNSKKFVEFYDVRDAARARTEMNGRIINGRRVRVEYDHAFLSNGPTLVENGGRSIQSNGGRSIYSNGGRSIHSNGGFQNSRFPRPPPPPRFCKLRSAAEARSKSGGGGTEGSMAPLSGGDGRVRVRVVEGDDSRKGGPNVDKGGKKLPEEAAVAIVESTAEAPPLRRRGPKGGRKKGFEDCFKMVGVGCRDSRTTVMIKNIPNRYSQKMVVNMMDSHCIRCNDVIAESGDDEPLSAYDFLYLPMDFSNKCNVGYGFVNMTTPEAARRLHKAFHGQPWEIFSSVKICEITYARLQGLKALEEHFRSSNLGSVVVEYLPAVFSPARDGKRLTPPLPLCVRVSPNPSSAGLVNNSVVTIPAADGKGDDDDGWVVDG